METDTYFITWHTIFILGMIPIIFGNGLIIACIYRFEKLQSTMNAFVANLAAADLLVGVVLIPGAMVGDYFDFRDDKYYCLTKLAIFNVSLGCSCYNLLLISIERFICVTCPLHSYKHLTKPRIAFMIIFGWILNFINSSMPLFGWNTYENNLNRTECLSDLVWDRGYKMYTTSMFWATNLLNVILYATVMRIALKRAKSTSLGRQNNMITRAKRDLRHLKTMIIVFGLFAICWAPYLAAAMVVMLHETPQTQFVRRCTLMIGFLNSALNWLVYGYRNMDFRKAFVKMLHLERCCDKPKSRRPTFSNISKNVPNCQVSG